MRIFITGGTSGIGLELAKAYLKSGHDVAVCGRDLTRLPKDIQEIFPQLNAYQVSVTDREEMEKIVKEFSGDQGIDLLIANAGRSHGSKTKTPDFEASRNIVHTNIIGTLNSFGPAVEIMIKQGHGHLVAVSSVAGFVGLPGASAYSASKSAVTTLCESYSLDLSKFGIDVTVICPGFVDTPLTRKNDHTMPFLMPVERAVPLIQKAIEKKKKLFIFPWQMKTVIVILNKMPRWMYRWVMNLSFLNYSK
jgi:short-subunit dehydrogenase